MVRDKRAITYTWNLRKGYKWTYLQNRNRLKDFEKLMLTKRDKGQPGVGRMDWSLGWNCSQIRL